MFLIPETQCSKNFFYYYFCSLAANGDAVNIVTGLLTWPQWIILNNKFNDWFYFLDISRQLFRQKIKFSQVWNAVLVDFFFADSVFIDSCFWVLLGQLFCLLEEFRAKCCLFFWRDVSFSLICVKNCIRLHTVAEVVLWLYFLLTEKSNTRVGEFNCILHTGPLLVKWLSYSHWVLFFKIITRSNSCSV